jgi:hypothetical protein
MHTLLLTLQLLMADTTDNPYPYFIKSPNVLDWKKYEVTVSKKYRDSILDVFKTDYPQFFESDYAKNNGNYEKSFHFVELNNDRFPDLIFEGWTGGEGTMVDIYIHRQWRMEKIFSDYMRIKDLAFTNKQLSGLVIYNTGCCAEFVMFERHYATDSKFKFTLARQRAIMAGMDASAEKHARPDGFFEKPFRFKITNEGYTLRYAPEISNTKPLALDIEDKDAKGNILATYAKDAEGIAWGYKKDATGREWWLVEMDPQSILSFSLYRDDNDSPTHYYGWMSSRFVEKIN